MEALQNRGMRATLRGGIAPSARAMKAQQKCYANRGSLGIAGVLLRWERLAESRLCSYRSGIVSALTVVAVSVALMTWRWISEPSSFTIHSHLTWMLSALLAARCPLRLVVSQCRASALSVPVPMLNGDGTPLSGS
jgi:hypothetical protein